jgi:tetratricopeptide (TPR) repeat protein
VDARIFYREVILPFQDAVTDPTKIRWRMGDIAAAEAPPIVLENLPVCGNCHSFTRDGGHMAMDVDYANSKGSYIITRTREEMTLATSDIITWDDYRREDQELTFGLLSQISPDGRVVVSTVKDKSVFVPVPKLAYSQLFFPIKGILCWYDRERKEFHALPGADDPVYVQSNPSWSPDGKDIVFARSKAYDLKNTSGQGKTLLTREECKEFVVDGKPFRFELFKIPFNEGKGGEPQPLAGASGDGKSSFFARYSPDGKWIVFCQASNYMLLQPDSALYIIPARGGEPRRMRCNLDGMNSWHSWSPNSRWLVFSSKANGPYTQLWLTHIDDQGESSPPIVLAKFTAADRAANIPEFVPLTNAVIRKINEKFLNDVSYVRAGNEFYRSGQADQAIANYRKALELNPNNSQAHQKLGFLLYNTKNEREEGANHLQDALRLEPDNPQANFDLGMALFDIGQNGPAIKHISRAIQLIPGGLDKQYNKADMRYQLGRVLFYDGQIPAGISSLMEAIQANPKHADAHYLLALAHAFQGHIDETVSHLNIALEINPALDRMPELRDRLALNYARAGQIEAARSESIKALELARKMGKTELANRIQQRIQN